MSNENHPPYLAQSQSLERSEMTVTEKGAKTITVPNGDCDGATNPGEERSDRQPQTVRKFPMSSWSESASWRRSDRIPKLNKNFSGFYRPSASRMTLGGIFGQSDTPA
jgi:hypothetical protein